MGTSTRESFCLSFWPYLSLPYEIFSSSIEFSNLALLPSCRISTLIPTCFSIHLLKSFWMRDDLVEVWNMGDVPAERRELVSSTSNALERYNRTLNENLGLHPNLVVFANLLDIVSHCFCLFLYISNV